MYRDTLLKDVASFWFPRCVDPEHGGFFTALDRDGVWMRPSEYGDPYPLARRFLEESAAWNLLPGPVGIDLPVRILQGAADPDVPWRHALALAGALTSQDLVFSLVRDGDHRLSRPQDIERLLAFVDELCG